MISIVKTAINNTFKNKNYEKTNRRNNKFYS